MPPGVVTVTWTTPLPEGEVTVTEVGVFAVMVASLEPKCTAVAPPRLVPVMTTLCPPPDDPWLGEMGTTASLKEMG